MASSTELDAIDWALLQELQKDARQTNKALAKKVGVAPSTCLERVRELRARGVITGFHAQVDPAAAGRSIRAVLSIQQRVAQRSAIDSLLDHVAALPETIRVFALTGTTDFIAHVAVRDTDHLRDLLWSLSERPEIARLQSSLILAHREGEGLAPLD